MNGKITVLCVALLAMTTVALMGDEGQFVKPSAQFDCWYDITTFETPGCQGAGRGRTGYCECRNKDQASYLVQCVQFGENDQKKIVLDTYTQPKCAGTASKSSYALGSCYNSTLKHGAYASFMMNNCGGG